MMAPNRTIEPLDVNSININIFAFSYAQNKKNDRKLIGLLSLIRSEAY